jgi:hypothetical protein
LISAKKVLDELRPHPEINEKSDKMVKIVGNYVPIYERYE